MIKLNRSWSKLLWAIVPLSTIYIPFSNELAKEIWAILPENPANSTHPASFVILRFKAFITFCWIRIVRLVLLHSLGWFDFSFYLLDCPSSNGVSIRLAVCLFLLYLNYSKYPFRLKHVSVSILFKTCISCMSTIYTKITVSVIFPDSFFLSIRAFLVAGGFSFGIRCFC